MNNFFIPNEDRIILRELAKKQFEYSHLPIMEGRTKNWYEHNDLKGKKPMVYVEVWTFAQDVLPKQKCTSELGRKIENEFYMNMVNYEMIDDDKVIPPYFSIGLNTWFKLFGVTIDIEHPKDGGLGHKFKYIINDLEEDFPKLGSSKYGADIEKAMEWKTFLESIFGDILPVKITMGSLYSVPTQDVVHMMGMENMLYAMYDYPETFHALMNRISDDYIEYFKWLESSRLLLPTTSHEGCGNGTFCYTNELPNKVTPEKTLLTTDVWGFMDSQETVSISPDMYEEFIFPYYKKVCENYGLLSYGCCEPVNPIWNNCLSKLKNLRKLSISPWCNEEFMGEKLRGSKVIYHRKPSPNFIGVGGELDEEAWKNHIIKTLKAAKGCKLEISQRDVYTLGGNINKPRRAVEIVRQLIEDYWE